MKTVTIPQKMSGTGTIHDLASQHFHREIKFPAGHKYAVVLAAYYGGRGYSTHRTEEAAITASNRQREFSHQVMDNNGNYYDVDVDYDALVRR